jgi:flagellar motor switch protein FliG
MPTLKTAPAAPTLNLRKAAVLLMSLPEQEAADILSRLDPKQVEAVSVEIARSESITTEEQNTIIQEFAESNPGVVTGVGGLNFAKNLMEKALGKDATSTIDSVKQQIQAMPFGFLQKVDSQNLITFISEEHPQTIALILSHLQAGQAAEIIKNLPADRQLSVIRRVATMGQTNPDIIKEVEEGLASRMAILMNQSFEKAGGVPKVAQILNVTDRATERALLDSLAQDDAELVDEIRRLMFVFEDIAKLGDKEIQTLLKNVDTGQWAMALKGASDQLKTKIFGNLSQRAADMLREEMEFLGAVKLSSVEQMQQQIVDIIRKLEDAGQIAVASAGDAEEALVQ